MDFVLFGNVEEKFMKKVIISANVLFTIANFRKDFISFLKAKNYDVVCVASEDELSSNTKNVLEHLGVKFIYVKMNRKGLNPLEDVVYMFNLYKIYKQYNADYVFHFTIKPNIYGTIAAKLAGVKSINTINGLGSAIIGGGVLAKVLQLFYKFSLNFSTKVFFQNEDDKNFFIDNKLVNEKKVAIVPGSGVDTTSFQDCKSQTRQYTFLMVSRLLKDKGVYEYIEAIKILKEKYSYVSFLLAGPFDNGNPSAITPNEVNQWQEDNIIQYLGQTNNIKVFLSKTNIVVLPSYREGLSRFLIESASASKPIITTNVAGCKEVVIENFNGFLCEAKNSYSLALAMEKMINATHEQIIQMGKNSQKIAQKKFDKDIVNKIYYQEIA